MINRSYLFLTGILWLFMAAGCSKNDPGGSSPCYLSDSALTGNYQITAATYQADAQAPVEDWYATWDTCDQHIIYQFLPTGEYYEQVESECGDSYYGSWHLSNSKLILYSLDSLEIRDYPITNFSCSSFTTRELKLTTGDIFTRTYTRK